MSADSAWVGEAGAEVRKCIYEVQRLTSVAECLERDLETARRTVAAAERDLAVAKRVYHAGRKDQDERIRSPRPSREKKRWLVALNKFPVFGSGEMKSAAAEIGWSASPGTLRTLASEYRAAGYFVCLDRGAFRLDPERIIGVIGEDIFADDAGRNTEPKALDSDAGLLRSGDGHPDDQFTEAGVSDAEDMVERPRLNTGDDDTAAGSSRKLDFDDFDDDDINPY